MKCKICSESFDNAKKLSLHIRHTHKISAKNYYDTYVKTSNDGICRFCGVETSYENIIKGYKDTCSGTSCKSRHMKEIRAKNALNKEKHSLFIQKVSKNQQAIWKQRKKDGTLTNISKKISKTLCAKNSELTEEERKHRFGWLNKLPSDLKEQWINDIMLKTGAHKWWKEASDEEKFSVIVKREATKKEVAEELVREYMKDPDSKQLYYASVQYLTEQTYQIHKEKIDPNNMRGKDWHIDHKYSVIKGFINKVPPQMIAHYHNLTIISAEENLKKSSNCSILIEELQMYYNSDPYLKIGI